MHLCKFWHKNRTQPNPRESETIGQTILMTGRIEKDFSLGNFNVTLDCFWRWPIGTLVDSTRGNPYVIPLKSVPSRGEICTLFNT